MTEINACECGSVPKVSDYWVSIFAKRYFITCCKRATKTFRTPEKAIKWWNRQIMLRTVERNEDMSPDRQLRIHRQDDGDILITIVSAIGRYTTVEFCTIGNGGGRSPKTLMALKNLMIAMEEDNINNPIST